MAAVFRAAVSSANRLEKIVDQLGLHWDGAALVALCTQVNEFARSQRPAPFAAAAIAADVVAMRPDSELFAWWLADLVLAQSRYSFTAESVGLSVWVRGRCFPDITRRGFEVVWRRVGVVAA
ncbi:DUF1403 family protein [Mesorhizobium sp. VK24D]|uniref:DUF1403 family protein n=1 Tax=Mesorhizobium album TaxID=3072314 RepID=A0ABU4XV53_9HYPH|nr:DUF1403 family protein [Mesorhizobium sp. VK24D]MDX8478574.1 DUF1403 family protein [Mesorhizobium sp. VK24D]